MFPNFPDDSSPWHSKLESQVRRSIEVHPTIHDRLPAIAERGMGRSKGKWSELGTDEKCRLAKTLPFCPGREMNPYCQLPHADHRISAMAQAYCDFLATHRKNPHQFPHPQCDSLAVVSPTIQSVVHAPSAAFTSGTATPASVAKTVDAAQAQPLEEILAVGEKRVAEEEQRAAEIAAVYDIDAKQPADEIRVQIPAVAPPKSTEPSKPKRGRKRVKVVEDDDDGAAALSPTTAPPPIVIVAPVEAVQKGRPRGSYPPPAAASLTEPPQRVDAAVVAQLSKKARSRAYTDAAVKGAHFLASHPDEVRQAAALLVDNVSRISNERRQAEPIELDVDARLRRQFIRSICQVYRLDRLKDPNALSEEASTALNSLLAIVMSPFAQKSAAVKEAAIKSLVGQTFEWPSSKREFAAAMSALGRALTAMQQQSSALIAPPQADRAVAPSPAPAAPPPPAPAAPPPPAPAVSPPPQTQSKSSKSSTKKVAAGTRKRR